MSKEEMHAEITVPSDVKAIFLIHHHVAIWRGEIEMFKFSQGSWVVKEISVLYLTARMPPIINAEDAVYILWGYDVGKKLLVQLQNFGARFPTDASIRKVESSYRSPAVRETGVTEIPMCISQRMRAPLEGVVVLQLPVTIHFEADGQEVSLLVTHVFIESGTSAQGSSPANWRLAWCYSQATDSAYKFMVRGQQTPASIDAFLLELARQSRTSTP